MGAQEIYDRLRTAPQHHPASVELFDDLTLQAGDIITVKSGTTSYEVPVFSQDIHWNGSAMTTVESTGNEKREPLPALRKREMNNQFVGNRRSYGYAKSAKQKQAQTDQWIEDFENTDLWINRDTIWAVSGAYQVWTDPTTGTKHIQLKDGALLEVDRGDGVYSTVGSSYAIEQVNNEVVNVIEGSALWTQRDGITGVCGEFSVITDPQTGKKRLKIANGTGLVLTRNNAEFGVYDDGTLTAGVIATKVNGVNSTHISGDEIYIGNNNTTTIINGALTRISNIEADYITASYINATNINAAFSGTQVFSTNYAYAKNFECVTFTQGDYTMDLSDGIKSLQITSSGNTYTLQKKHFYSLNWETVGSFSRATSLSGEWSGTVTAGKSFKVTASPQGNSYYSPQLDDIYTSGSKVWASDYLSFNQTIRVQDESGEDLFEETLTFDTTVAFNQGKSKGESEFTLATVTLQGGAYGDITPIGTSHHFDYALRYQAGSSATYYNAGSTSTYYNAGSTVTYYKGNGSTITGRGSSVSVTPVSTSHHLKYQKLYTDGTTAQWAYVSVTSGQTSTWYNAGSSATYYKGDGSKITGRGNSVSVTLQGSSVNVTKQGSSVSVTKQGATQWVYVSDSSGTSIFYSAGSKVTGLRKAGTADSTTYYTRSSS